MHYYIVDTYFADFESPFPLFFFGSLDDDLGITTFTVEMFWWFTLGQISTGTDQGSVLNPKLLITDLYSVFLGPLSKVVILIIFRFRIRILPLSSKLLETFF